MFFERRCWNRAQMSLRRWSLILRTVHSLNDGVFPHLFKMAQVLPLLTKTGTWSSQPDKLSANLQPLSTISLNWLQSYLTDRRQYVKLCRHCSDWRQSASDGRAEIAWCRQSADSCNSCATLRYIHELHQHRANVGLYYKFKTIDF